MSALTKAIAYPWLREKLEDEGLDVGHVGFSKAWDFAWEPCEDIEANTEAWKAWVGAAVDRATAPNVKNPPGLLLKILQEGPSSDLGKAPKASVNLADYREAEGRKALDQVRELRASMDGVAVLPLAALSAAHRMYREGGEASPKRCVHELVQAWERDGSPDPATWDYPGWSLCMEAAR